MAEHTIQTVGEGTCHFIGGSGRIEFKLENGQVATVACDVQGEITTPMDTADDEESNTGESNTGELVGEGKSEEPTEAAAGKSEGKAQKPPKKSKAHKED